MTRAQVWREVAAWIRQRRQDGECCCVTCIEDEADDIEVAEAPDWRNAPIEWVSSYCANRCHVLCNNQPRSLRQCTCGCHNKE